MNDSFSCEGIQKAQMWGQHAVFQHGKVTKPPCTMMPLISKFLVLCLRQQLSCTSEIFSYWSGGFSEYHKHFGCLYPYWTITFSLSSLFSTAAPAVSRSVLIEVPSSRWHTPLPTVEAWSLSLSLSSNLPFPLSLCVSIYPKRSLWNINLACIWYSSGWSQHLVWHLIAGQCRKTK